LSYTLPKQLTTLKVKPKVLFLGHGHEQSHHERIQIWTICSWPDEETFCHFFALWQQNPDYLVNFGQIVGYYRNQPKLAENRGQKRAARTRKKLNDLALDIFSEKTVDTTTIEEITKKADVGTGTWVQHVSSKEGIVVSLGDDSDHSTAQSAIRGLG